MIDFAVPLLAFAACGLALLLGSVLWGGDDA